MGRLKIEKVNIDTLRKFKNVTFKFGDNVTLIAGQNGTSKSTLLGMLAQPLQFGKLRGTAAKISDNSVYTNHYHGIKLHEYLDLKGDHFLYDCEDVFRLSLIHDHPDEKQYLYNVVLKGDIIDPSSPIYKSGLTVYSKHKPNSNAPNNRAMRFVAGPGKSHEKGQGNFPHPVIYLGLNRLWPLALNKKCKVLDVEVNPSYRNWYVKNYNQILCLEEYDNSAEILSTSHKNNFIAPSSSNYNGESCSAGQDNLGQILTAVLSFRKLKEELGNIYQGGLLLIDELDATFHAHAQKMLLKILVDASKELDLQIIATTHSLLLLEQAYRSEIKSKVKVMYLLKQDNEIVEAKFNNFEDIEHHLNVTSPTPKKPKNHKASVFFEDNLAKNFFNAIIGSTLKSYIHYVNIEHTGAGDLSNLARLQDSTPELHKTIIIPDGDVKNDFKYGRSLVFLPGDERPETLIYKLLFSLPDKDIFWKSINPTYNRGVAITSKGGDSLEIGEDKTWVKKWYNEQSTYWGRSDNMIFKCWIRHNKDKCYSFCKEFLKKLNYICCGAIPKDKINSILDKYK